MTDPLAPAGPERDGYGRPKIIPLLDGQPNLDGKLIAYTRASTFCKALSDAGGLTTWKVRHVAVAIASNPDLAAMAGALGSNPDDFDAAQKRSLDEIIETAHDRSGGNAKANYGTAIHSLTEPDNTGFVPDPMRPDVDAYTAALDAYGIKVVDSERFVVNDALQVAGTYDHCYELTRDVRVGDDVIGAGAKLIGDKKTGGLHFDEHAIQLAIYAGGDLYDHETGERTPHGASQEWGVLAHIPNGAGKADLYLVDLQVGYDAALMCQDVRKYRSAAVKKAQPFPPIIPATIDTTVTVDVAETLDELDKAAALIETAFSVDPLLAIIAATVSPEELRALWSTNRAAWTDAYTEAVKARLAVIGG